MNRIGFLLSGAYRSSCINRCRIPACSSATQRFFSFSSTWRKDDEAVISDAVLKHVEILKKKHTENMKKSEEIEDKGSKEYIKVCKDLVFLDTVLAANHNVNEFQRTIDELNAMKIEEKDDQDLIKEIDAELEVCRDGLYTSQQELLNSILPPEPMEDSNVILEFRCGVGGSEAMLFVEDMHKLYEKFCQRSGLNLKTISVSPYEGGGFREIVCSTSGKGAYGLLKYESGTHRVQRVPATEMKGRTHTSTITISVIPETEMNEIEIKKGDLRIETYKSSGPGGQHVNTTDSAVRITHIPTGVVCQSQDQRSQQLNKSACLTNLKLKLYQAQQEQADKEKAALKKEQVGAANRSDKVRTYNYAQDRLTDHRIGESVNLNDALQNGNIGKLIDNLHKAERLKALANL